MWHQGTTKIVDWICIIMFILGILGNSLGLIIFSSRKFRRTTYGRLAIASLIINLLCVIRYSLLLHSNARRWLTYKVGQSWFNCKLYRFSSCLRVLSALVIVAWTYERFTYVTINYRFFTNRPFVKRYKFYFMAFISLIIVGILTGPTVYFYESRLSIYSNYQIKFQQNITSTTSFRLSNSSYQEGYTLKNEDLTTSHSYRSLCALKESISTSWNTFFIDVRFGFNYTTLRSILSEIIPSLLVIFFDIGIIIHVVISTSTISSNGPSMNVRANYRGSFQSKDGVDGLIVHNRPRTSWMNIVLIIHSFLFCFSSLTASIVHWSTSNPLLSYSTSVVILANCSLNFYVYCLSGKSFRHEIRKLFYRYFQLYCFERFMNLFRTKSQQEEIAQIVRMRLVRHRSTIIPGQSIGHFRGTSSPPTCN
ncbi:unnamed protein product [Rotaria sp. Silwood1]|nr:unnamed protein product [Rotaria sp. Silwood1]CAF1624626.1 unnamed protein product [Rotaria sp. Silwood1]CAF3757963.1 unnamed protein product [Rotaria sp. Silwood1]CAF3783904.1 unnamed protein product [Rotaria sp. Silwood1]CAF3817793.1 unnamed protein product [Rotaria sp. Silwood1]